MAGAGAAADSAPSPPARLEPDPAAVVFDLFGTLLDVGSLVDWCAEHLPEGAAERLVPLWRAKQLEYSWLRSLMGRYADFLTLTIDALHYAAERLDIGLEPAIRDRLVDGWFSLQPFPDVEPALVALAPRPLAILSNGSPEMLDRAVAAAGLADRFAHVISVHEAGVYKPASAVYSLAEDRLVLPRDRILFVSANGWDAAGASAFGFSVIHVNRVGDPPERLPSAPTHVVPGLVALVDALEGRARQTG